MLQDDRFTDEEWSAERGITVLCNAINQGDMSLQFDDRNFLGMLQSAGPHAEHMAQSLVAVFLFGQHYNKRWSKVQDELKRSLLGGNQVGVLDEPSTLVWLRSVKAVASVQPSAVSRETTILVLLQLNHSSYTVQAEALVTHKALASISEGYVTQTVMWCCDPQHAPKLARPSITVKGLLHCHQHHQALVSALASYISAEADPEALALSCQFALEFFNAVQSLGSIDPDQLISCVVQIVQLEHWQYAPYGVYMLSTMLYPCIRSPCDPWTDAMTSALINLLFTIVQYLPVLDPTTQAAMMHAGQKMFATLYWLLPHKTITLLADLQTPTTAEPLSAMFQSVTLHPYLLFEAEFAKTLIKKQSPDDINQLKLQVFGFEHHSVTMSPPPSRSASQTTSTSSSSETLGSPLPSSVPLAAGLPELQQTVLRLQEQVKQKSHGSEHVTSILSDAQVAYEKLLNADLQQRIGVLRRECIQLKSEIAAMSLTATNGNAASIAMGVVREDAERYSSLTADLAELKRDTAHKEQRHQQEQTKLRQKLCKVKQELDSATDTIEQLKQQLQSKAQPKSHLVSQTPETVPMQYATTEEALLAQGKIQSAGIDNDYVPADDLPSSAMGMKQSHLSTHTVLATFQTALVTTKVLQSNLQFQAEEQSVLQEMLCLLATNDHELRSIIVAQDQRIKLMQVQLMDKEQMVEAVRADYAQRLKDAEDRYQTLQLSNVRLERLLHNQELDQATPRRGEQKEKVPVH
eukprot:m.80575 g.80575  ORF g.80575 m.80575 type:complete len:747 (+) comp12605_c0_seq5:220-2460(+)